jgi:hypothetical protein
VLRLLHPSLLLLLLLQPLPHQLLLLLSVRPRLDGGPDPRHRHL